MKKMKFFAAILSLSLIVQLFAVGASAKLVVGVSGVPEHTEAFVQPLSIPTDLPSDNLLGESNFDSIDCVSQWTKQTNSMILEWLCDDNGGYLRTDAIPYNYFGYRLKPTEEVPAGIYKFTGYFRTYNRDELTSLRVEFEDADNKAMVTLNVNCDNEWMKVEYYVTLTSALDELNVCGKGYPEFFQDYCMDEFSLVPVDSIPSGANTSTTFGENWDRQTVLEIAYANAGGYSDTYDPETYLEKYKVNGIMLNNDADGTLHNVGGNTDTVTEEDFIGAIMQYKDTQVTDFMLTVCNEIATYPSNVWTSYLDKYHQTEENGIAVDYTEAAPCKGAHHIWETLGIDYIGLWAETLNDIGINPWLSFRMNDAHERNVATHWLQSDYFHENPHLYRVKHHNFVSYMDKTYDYTYPEVREHYLQLINEALSRYDVYGLELDFQRERFLWHIGGEHRGLDIFNQFMRELYDVVAIYEEKYGHDIKIAVRVPSDPQTCYEFGLDVITWAAEGTVDHVTVTGRFECTDFDMPIRLWDSILTPYGVTLAAGIDTAYVRPNTSKGNMGWTPELYAGFCASAYSQGADKIYILNMNTSVTSFTSDDERFTIGTDSTINSSNSRWIFTTNMGSYDKVIEMNRRCIITFNDSPALWNKYQFTLSKTISRGTVTTLRIPVGDITVGSKVTLDISMPKAQLEYGIVPRVYINSVQCTYTGYGTSRPGGVANFTDDPVLHYDVPVEAQEDYYMVIEIEYDGSTSYTMEHVEVYIQPRNAN